MPERSANLSRLGAALAVLVIVGCSKSNEEPLATSTDNLASTNAALVVSQVYGGAGMPGAAYARDYVELFNRSAAPVSLARLSLQFANSAGELTPIAKLPENVSVPAGGYYLVGFGGGNDGADLKVDLGGLSANILPGSGKIALVREGAKAPLDVVGYGDASDAEGDAPARSTARTEALFRKGAGCTDTDSNASDFEPAKAAPRNAKSAPHLCGAK